jgi:hypothetical protein
MLPVVATAQTGRLILLRMRRASRMGRTTQLVGRRGMMRMMERMMERRARRKGTLQSPACSAPQRAPTT